MRRTKSEFEQAEREYKQARRVFESALETWEIAEARREEEYNGKLHRALSRLSDLGFKAVSEVLKNTPLEPVWISYHLRPVKPDVSALQGQDRSSHPVTSNLSSTPSTTTPASEPASTNTPVVFETKFQAEFFHYESQRLLTLSLKELKRQFVTILRMLADRAIKERYENLRKAIKSLKDDLQPDLQDEILSGLDPDAANVQSLAFRKSRKNFKTKRIRSEIRTCDVLVVPHLF